MISVSSNIKAFCLRGIIHTRIYEHIKTPVCTPTIQFISTLQILSLNDLGYVATSGLALAPFVAFSSSSNQLLHCLLRSPPFALTVQRRLGFLQLILLEYIIGSLARAGALVTILRLELRTYLHTLCILRHNRHDIRKPLLVIWPEHTIRFLHRRLDIFNRVFPSLMLKGFSPKVDSSRRFARHTDNSAIVIFVVDWV